MLRTQILTDLNLADQEIKKKTLKDACMYYTFWREGEGGGRQSSSTPQ